MKHSTMAAEGSAEHLAAIARNLLSREFNSGCSVYTHNYTASSLILQNSSAVQRQGRSHKNKYATYMACSEIPAPGITGHGCIHTTAAPWEFPKNLNPSIQVIQLFFFILLLCVSFISIGQLSGVIIQHIHRSLSPTSGVSVRQGLSGVLCRSASYFLFLCIWRWVPSCILLF
jgi:hypothetical protein